MKTAWTTVADLRAQVLRRWDKGELLAELVTPGELFPLRLSLRGPTSAELSERFEEARTWVAGLQHGAGYRLVMREVRHRVIGQNSLPGEAWVETLDDALRIIGKARDARAFQAMVSVTLQRQPSLLTWMRQQPLRALSLAGVWPQLLDVVVWLQAHPRPGIYLRQVDLSGIDSKFIEAQRGVLSELLDLALPQDAIDGAASGAAQFAQRYGFRDKPLRVRVRFLDPGHVAWVPGADADITVSQDAFARLAPDMQRVFITENEINFLAFPPAAGSLLVFGAGYGFDALAQAAQAAWLRQRDVYYWGDIDTHGFAILDQLRAHVPQAQSLLMDHDTLLAHQAQWTPEPQPTQRDLPRLNEAERRLYDDLRWRRLRPEPLRLEQERIAYGSVERAVAAALQ
ncbi:MAG: hypothetical protein ABT20_19620 [Rubrivivax sp. SCN 70-15]|nr:MAG: hypothetical protein ABT20_19620 [Rubrivivax sp. SCN 70-15]